MRRHRQRPNQSAWWWAAILGLSLAVALLIAGRESEGGYRFDRPNPDGPTCHLGDDELRLCRDPLVCVDRRPAGGADQAPPDAPTIKAAGAADPVGAGLATSNAPDTDGTGLILLGRVTHYGESYNGQPLGCGTGDYSSADVTIVAVSPARYNEWPCGTRFAICGPGGCISATRQDACPGCSPSLLDLSEAGFAAVCGEDASGSCAVEIAVPK